MKKVLKLISVMLIASFVMTFVVACGAAPAATAVTVKAPDSTKAADTSAAPQKIKMRVETYMTGSDPYAQVWQNTIKDYMAKNPNVEIVDEATPAADNAFKTKVTTDFASGNEPDVMFGFTSAADAKPLVESGKLMTWEDEIAKDTSWSGVFSKAALDGVKYTDGKIYGLPYIGYCEGMYVNKDLFDANGLAIPKTYDDILKAISVFKAKKIVPITVSIAEEPHYLIESFILSAGGKAGHSTAFDPSWALGLDKIKELYQKGAFPQDVLTIKSALATQLFTDKKAAMFISGSWSAGSIKDTANTIFIPVPLLPNAKADASELIAGFGSGWYVNKDTDAKNNGAMKAFAKYLTTPGVLAKFIGVGGVPALNGVKLDNVTPLQQQIWDAIKNAKSVDVPVDSRIKPESFTAIWKTGLPSIVTGKKTVQQVLDEAKTLNQ